jgi:hypothetical protein
MIYSGSGYPSQMIPDQIPDPELGINQTRNKTKKKRMRKTYVRDCVFTGTTLKSTMIFTFSNTKLQN